VSNSATGEVGSETVFAYHQEGTIVTGTYQGGAIVTGQLLATVDSDGALDMAYHHVNANGEVRSGRCTSRPEVLADGRVRLHEPWQWLTGDRSGGTSTVEDV
jgi:hypothetical protein